MAQRDTPGQGPMPGHGGSTRLRRYAVYTQGQVAAMCGVTKRAIRDTAKARMDKGQFVGWTAEDPDNPAEVLLLSADWVRSWAHGVHGVTELSEPLVVPLPAVEGISPLPDLPAPEDTLGPHAQELARRLASAEQLAEANKQEAVEVTLAAARSEADAARAEAERARQDAADTRSQLEGELIRLRRLVAEQAETISRQADLMAHQATATAHFAGRAG